MPTVTFPEVLTKTLEVIDLSGAPSTIGDTRNEIMIGFMAERLCEAFTLAGYPLKRIRRTLYCYNGNHFRRVPDEIFEFYSMDVSMKFGVTKYLAASRRFQRDFRKQTLSTLFPYPLEDYEP